MRHPLAALSWIAVASVLLIAAGCGGSNPKAGGATAGGGGGGSSGGSGELDKLMRTRMNAAYSQLVFLVFHSEGEPNFAAISEEEAKLSEAITGVLKLPIPAMIQSEQGRSMYVDLNNTLERDNQRFAEATARQDHAAMSESLKKVGETCSKCHHFFRVSIDDHAD